MRASVVVCSDSAAAGLSEDTTGPVLVAGLRELGCDVADPVIVPDDIDTIIRALHVADADVVVCTGGTGLGPRDVTPDAVLSLIDRQLPGFGEALRALGRQHTPLADLSRAVAGTVGSKLIVAIPGSHGGVADGLAVLGPMLGHAHAVMEGAGHRALVRETPLSATEIQAWIQSPGAGASVTFEGRVRDHDHDRRVVSLTYEAHPTANDVMQEVIAEARELPGVIDAGAAHRFGDLSIGDLAFVAAVSAAHRSEAFQACAWLVDEVKRRVPMWKLQHFADGTKEWVNCA